MRTKIREAIFRAAREVSGYRTADTHTGFVVRMNEGGFQLPCIWLCPLLMTAKTTDIRTYAGVLYIHETAEGLTAEEEDDIWGRMETAAIHMLNSAAKVGRGCFLVENVRCTPSHSVFTGSNALSVMVQFDVKIKHCECQ